MKETIKVRNSLATRLLLVLLAFLLMIVSSCLIMYFTLNKKMIADAEMTMDDTQTLFSRILMEPEMVLHLIASNIEGIYNRGEGYDTIKDYVTETSQPEFKEHVKIDYYDVYVFFEENDEFYDGLGWEPGPDYRPRERLWYMAAIEKGDDVGITPPYIDAETGNLVISYSHALYSSAGGLIGVVCFDVYIDYLRDLVVNKHITPNSYGLMVEENGYIAMHPDPQIEGEIFGMSNPAMLKFADDIEAGADISLGRTVNYEGISTIAFGRQLDNGWYFMLLIPEMEYYSELFNMILITGILGAVLAGMLIVMLVGIERAKRKAEEEHREKVVQLAEAEGASQAKSAFLARMSHEIRTPMNAILGITEIQLQNETLPAGTKEALSKIYSSGDMLLSIINDILDLSKIEAGKLELNIGEYEFSSMLVDTVQLNLMRLGSKPIKFSIKVSPEIPVTLCGDELRVKQILNNILSNAFKYTSRGSVTLTATAEKAGQLQMPASDIHPDGDGIENGVILIFEISDTGHGMTAAQVAKLGEQYSRFTTTINRATEGTGLGMSITKNLLHMMGGEVSVRSVPGKGSTFTVRIPQGRADDNVLGEEGVENLRSQRMNTATRMKRSQITREPMPYGSVLIVDDVETNIYVASGLLTPYGLKIESAVSGHGAIEKVKSGKVYDIILMDHMMPIMDGIETTRKLREMGYMHPIVALTANALAGQAEMFLSNGFDDFLSKPVDLRQLNAVLNKWVRDKQKPEVIEAARRSAASLPDMEQDIDDLITDGQDAAVLAEIPDELPGEDGGAAGINIAFLKDNPQLAESFVNDAAKAVLCLEKIVAKNGVYTDDDIHSYTICVHGLKSMFAAIGAGSLSDDALRLETLGREGDAGAIAVETPPFLHSLTALINEITDGK